MAGVGVKSDPTKARKRVEADNTSANAMRRGKNGSAFVKCDECNKDVAVALIDMHDCSLDAKIKMNLESCLVEPANETNKKQVERKKGTTKEPKAKKAKTSKSKDPNKPKRPPTAFFLFMDDFRKEFKEANPDSKDVKRVAKEGGEKWKSMTNEEKQPYLDRASELKAEYDKALESKDDNNEDDEVAPEKDASEDEAVEKEASCDEVPEKEGGDAEVQDISDDE